MKVLFYFLAALSLAIIWRGLPQMSVLSHVVFSILALVVLHLIFDRRKEPAQQSDLNTDSSRAQVASPSTMYQRAPVADSLDSRPSVSPSEHEAGDFAQSTKSNFKGRSQIVVIAFGIMLVSAGFLVTAPWPATIGYYAFGIAAKLVGYGLCLAVVAALIAGIARRMRAWWMPIFAWLLLLAGGFDLLAGLLSLSASRILTRKVAGVLSLDKTSQSADYKVAKEAESKHDNASEAIAVFQRATALEPNNAEAWDGLAHAYAKQRSQAKSSDWVINSAEASMRATSIRLPALEKTTAANPDDVERWKRLGDAYWNLGKKSEAVSAFQRATAIAPDDLEAWYGLGLAYRDEKSTSEAVAAFKRAIAIKPDYADAWSGLGSAYLLMEKPREAAAAFAQHVALNPNDFYAWQTLGQAHERAGSYVEAADGYRQMIKLEPTNWIGWFDLGQVLEKQGRLPEAVDAYRKCVALDQTAASSWFWLGLACEKQGKNAEANAAYNRAEQIEPGFVKTIKARLGRPTPAR